MKLAFYLFIITILLHLCMTLVSLKVYFHLEKKENKGKAFGKSEKKNKNVLN